MDVARVSAESISNQQLAATAAQVGVQVERKSLDIQAQQGQALIAMMNSSAGVGQTLNTQA